MEITSRNTNTLQPRIYSILKEHGMPDISRNGRVLRIDGPVTIELTHPTERVNFCPVRNANPFFHYIEALAILANWNNIQLLAYFAANMLNYSDDGLTQNAFYGTRLRKTWGDQLNAIIRNLSVFPDSRQEVALIWNPEDLTRRTKDKACNLLLMFAVRDNRLTMTSVNRSNDAIWGGVSGANIVHLSMIQEYVALSLGIECGEWWHFSNNLHVYMDNPKWEALQDAKVEDPYSKGQVRSLPLFPSPRHRWDWDAAADQFLMRAHNAIQEKQLLGKADNMYMMDAVTMFDAWQMYKSKTVGSIEINNHLQQVAADDWRVACQAWITRRFFDPTTTT